MNWGILGVLRFALASIVACAHVIYFDRSPLALFIASMGAKAAVVGFLLVSGFSIAASLDRGERGFYFRRFRRIYPVYITAVLTGIALEYWLGEFSVPFYQFHPTGPLSAMGSVLMLQTFLVKSIAYNPVIWSLAVECAFYLLAPFILGRTWIICALCAVSIIFYLLPHGDRGLLYTAALRANAVKYFWPFGFGILLYQQRTTVTFLACGLTGAITVKLSHLNYEPLAAATYLVSIATIWAATKTCVKSPTMDYLGDISYPLYLFQFPVFVLMFKLFGIIDSIALFCGAVAVAAIAYELIDVRLKPILFRRVRKTAHATS